MPVDELWVEGELDQKLLQAVLGGRPSIVVGGSKNELPRRVREKNKVGQIRAAFVRDRDFDYEPPTVSDIPTQQAVEGGMVLGWRWCRHETENYLLEPTLVNMVFGWPVADYQLALRGAAIRIRPYQIARWVVGRCRFSIPLPRVLSTRPSTTGDHGLPNRYDDLVEMPQWALQHTEAFRTEVQAAVGVASVNQHWANLSAILTEDFFRDTHHVLNWCSGKNLLFALQDWFRNQQVSGHRLNDWSMFQARVVEWIVNNGDRVLDLLPEWREFHGILRA